MLRRFASNALANLTTGISSTFHQVGLTAIASRSFDSIGFAAWSLAVSLSALAPLFSVSLSTIVTRQLVELPKPQHPVLLIAARRVARGLSLIAFVAIILIALGMQYASQPARAFGSTSFCLLVALLVLSQVWQVVFQPSFGWFYAHEQNWGAARVIVAARVFATSGMGLLCWLVSGNPALAALFVAAGAALGLAVGGRARLPTAVTTVANGPHHLQTDAVRQRQKAMMPLLKAFAVWSIGATAIQYGLPAFISIIAPAHFSAFFLAFTLNQVVIGTVATAASALLAPLARKRLAGDFAHLEMWLSWAPVATAAALVALMTSLWFAMPYLLAAWSPGVATANDVRAPFYWLAMQTIARSMTLIHSVLLSSTGRPAQLSRPIFFELALALLFAVPLGYYFGESAFLAALAGAGLFTAIFTVRLTLWLDVCRPESRTRLMLGFLLSQALALSLWHVISG
jgi:hypothetical protein